jgi:hypothetical protein
VREQLERAQPAAQAAVSVAGTRRARIRFHARNGTFAG